MNLQGKRILVTGADGFIGSLLTEELVRRGHDVRTFIHHFMAKALILQAKRGCF